MFATLRMFDWQHSRFVRVYLDLGMLYLKIWWGNETDSTAVREFTEWSQQKQEWCGSASRAERKFPTFQTKELHVRGVDA